MYVLLLLLLIVFFSVLWMARGRWRRRRWNNSNTIKIRQANKEHGLKMSSRVWLHFPTFHLAFASYRSVYLFSLSLFFEYLSCFRLLCTRKAKCFPRYIQDKSWYACFSFASPPPSLLPPCLLIIICFGIIRLANCICSFLIFFFYLFFALFMLFQLLMHHLLHLHFLPFK